MKYEEIGLETQNTKVPSPPSLIGSGCVDRRQMQLISDLCT